MQLRDRSRKFIGPSPTKASSDGIGGKSSAVMTALTPGKARAFSVWIAMMRAWACGLRLTLPHSIPGMTMSAPKLAFPVTLSTPSGRIGRVPTTFCNSFGIYVMKPDLRWAPHPNPLPASGEREGPATAGGWGAGYGCRLLCRGAQRLGFVQRRPQPRRRHWQIAQPNSRGVGDRVGDRRHWRYDRHLAAAAGAERMARVRHLYQDRVDHRHVGGDRHAIVEEAWIFEPPVLVVDVFLAQRPADPLRHAALHLPFDIGGVDRAADILDRGVTQDLDVTGLLVDLDIADMGREAGRLALRVDLHLGADRSAGARRFSGDRGQVERLEAAGIGAGRDGFSILPLDRLGADVPHDRGAFFQFLDDLLRRLRHGHAAGESDTAPARRGAKADRRRVADDRTDSFERNAEHLGHHHRHRSARAADVGMALGYRNRAVLVDVAGGTRLSAGIVPVAGGDATALIGAERHAQLRVRFRGLDGLHIADVVPGRAVRRFGAVLGAVDLAHLERVDAELAGQLVDAAFDPERADRRAGSAVGGNFGAIAENVVADRFGVGQVVDRKSTDAALLHR